MPDRPSCIHGSLTAPAIDISSLFSLEQQLEWNAQAGDGLLAVMDGTLQVRSALSAFGLWDQPSNCSEDHGAGAWRKSGLRKAASKKLDRNGKGLSALGVAHRL